MDSTQRKGSAEKYLPTPEQLAAEIEAIRSGWTRTELIQRGTLSDDLAVRRRINAWRKARRQRQRG